MESWLQFIIWTVGVFIVWMLWSLRGRNLKEYFSSPDGLGILKGIIIALVVVIGSAFASKAFADNWFYEASIYAGLDYTHKISPQCVSNSADDRTTSNLGFRGGIYRTDDRLSFIRYKYTHHSCAFGVDRNSYDSFFGVEFERILWSR